MQAAKHVPSLGTPRSACVKMLAFGATELSLKINTPVGVSCSIAIPRALPVLSRHSASPQATRRKSLNTNARDQT